MRLLLVIFGIATAFAWLSTWETAHLIALVISVAIMAAIYIAEKPEAEKPDGAATKYLAQNPLLRDMTRKLRFLRSLDRARYDDLLAKMNKLQKIYMGILAGKYPSHLYVGTFFDVRDQVHELLYSLVFVKGSSKREPRVSRVIDAFWDKTTEMAFVLRNFCRDKCPGYFPDIFPRPYEQGRHDRLP